MTRESPTEASTISTSLTSTIRKSLQKHELTVRIYDESRPALKREIRLLKREKYRDQKSIDARTEQLQIWSFAILGHELLATLADRLETNPFPSQRLTLREIAFRLVPNVKSAVWFAIFSIFELSANERFYFPAAEEDWDAEAIEGKLWKLLGEREAVPVKEVKEVMPWGTNSKTYIAVKRELQERGWLWRSLKREGVVSKVIFPPKGNRSLPEGP